MVLTGGNAERGGVRCTSTHDRRRRDRRERVRRARRRGAARRGGPRRLRRPGEGREPRRHLARQHLPGLRLRRAVAPVLVLLRPEPGLDARCSPASRRSAPTWRASPTATGCATGSGSAPRSRRPRWARRHWKLRSPTASQVRARVVVWGTGALHEPSVPDIAGLDEFAGTAFHSARWRPRPRPDRPSRRGDRHRRERRSSSSRQIAAAGRVAGAVPAHRRRGCCPSPTARCPRRCAALYRGRRRRAEGCSAR